MVRKLKQINATTYEADFGRARVEIGDIQREGFIPACKIYNFENETSFRMAYANRPYSMVTDTPEPEEIDKLTLTEAEIYLPYEIGKWYEIGDLLEYEGGLYEVVQAHTSQEDWPPPDTPALYKTSTLQGTIGDWKQPQGAHDAYEIDVKVRHTDKIWKSLIADNVWEPGVYGWEETDGQVDVECYCVEGLGEEENIEGFEFEVILKDKPQSNIVEFELEMEGLKAHYQPELTQEEKDEGVHRPENVIGSYAVYHATCGNMHKGQANAEKYRTGKAFHIYRPKVIDNSGDWVWAELNLGNGILTVTIPQEFLDTAVYPVRVDPTFGYVDAEGEPIIGGSGAEFKDAIWGLLPYHTVPNFPGGYITGFHIWFRVRYAGDSYNIRGGLYTDKSPSYPDELVGSSDLKNVPYSGGTGQWYSITEQSLELESGHYWLVVGFWTDEYESGQTWPGIIALDTTVADYSYVRIFDEPGTDLPDTFPPYESVWDTRAWSVYCTYEAAPIYDVIINTPTANISANSLEPTTIPTPPITNNVLFNYRKDVIANYDQDLIDFMVALGYNIVETVNDTDLEFADLENADLLVIGAPDSDWVSHHTSGDTIENSTIPVLSFCRGVSRNHLFLAHLSGAENVDSFRLVDPNHEIPQAINWTSGFLTMGDTISVHRLISVIDETVTIADYGGEDELSLGYRVMNNRIGMHFGYHRVDLMTSDGLALLEATLHYLNPIAQHIDATVNTPAANVSANSFAPVIFAEFISNVTVLSAIQEAQVQGFTPNVVQTANITILPQPPPASAEALTSQITTNWNVTLQGTVGGTSVEGLAPTVEITKNTNISGEMGEVVASTWEPGVDTTANITVSSTGQDAHVTGLSAEIETTKHITVSVPIANVSGVGHEAAIGLTGNIDVFAPSSNAIGESFIPDAELTRNIAVANGVGVADAQSIIPGIEFTKNVEINATVANLITDTMLVSIETEIPDFALTATQDLHNIVLTWEVGE